MHRDHRRKYSSEHVLTTSLRREYIPRNQWYEKTNSEYTHHQFGGNGDDEGYMDIDDYLSVGRSISASGVFI